MRRYIDADQLKKVFRYTEDAEYARWTSAGILYEIDDIEAADVVEVVRCKDCAMYKKDKELAEANYCDPNVYCGLLRTEMAEDGYCSYGRRKDE